MAGIISLFSPERYLMPETTSFRRDWSRADEVQKKKTDGQTLMRLSGHPSQQMETKLRPWLHWSRFLLENSSWRQREQQKGITSCARRVHKFQANYCLPDFIHFPSHLSDAALRCILLMRSSMRVYGHFIKTEGIVLPHFFVCIWVRLPTQRFRSRCSIQFV